MRWARFLGGILGDAYDSSACLSASIGVLAVAGGQLDEDRLAIGADTPAPPAPAGPGDQDQEAS